MQMPLSKAKELLMLLRAYSNKETLKRFKGVHINIQMLEVIRTYGSSLEETLKAERVSNINSGMPPSTMIKIMRGE